MVCSYTEKRAYVRNVIDYYDEISFKSKDLLVIQFRPFSINRPDKVWNKLSVTEKEIGGIPNSSEDVKQAHAAAIESYIEMFVGYNNEQYGTMYFQRTLEDWAKFDINKRTKHDASISSGLAIMACNKNKYRPVPEIIKEKVSLNFSKYDNKGYKSKIIN